MTAARQRVAVRPVAAFLVLACALAWAWWGQLLLRGVERPDRLWDSHLPALLAPAVAAVLIAWVNEGPSAIMDIAARIIRPWRQPWLILGSLALPMALAGLVWMVAGGAGSLWAYPGIPPGSGLWATLAIALVCNAFGEEAGWRGFLLEHLEPLGRLRATLLVGLAWALWHLPAFFLPFGLGAHVSGLSVMGWGVSILAGSVVLGWVWFASGGALGAVCLWHLGFNLATATDAMQGLPAMTASACVIAMAVPIARRWWRTKHRSLA